MSRRFLFLFRTRMARLQRRADNARIIQEFCRHDLRAASEMLAKLVEFSADAAADDNQIGREQFVNLDKKFIHALRPFFP